MSDEKIERTCRKQVGYKSVLLLTETGIARFCKKVAPYIKGEVAGLSSAIVGACRNYVPELQPKTKPEKQ